MNNDPAARPASLAGQRIILFGGTSGVGFAVAQRARADGAEVVLASSNPAKVQAATEQLPGSTGLAVDVTDEAAVERAFARLGSFDHLVFTAGDWGRARRAPAAGNSAADSRDERPTDSFLRTPLVDLDLEDAHRIFGVRFWGFTAVVKHAAGRIAPHGSITNTNGLTAHRPLKGSAMTTAMAGSLEFLTRGLAVELAPIRVNCVCLGAIRTWVWESIPEEQRDAHFRQLIARQPLPRAGEPSEAAEAFLYLMRCGYVTGQVLHVDGGGSVI